VLWVSVAAANASDSPLVGLIVLTVSAVLFVSVLGR
jgi:hypothetical protein